MGQDKPKQRDKLYSKNTVSVIHDGKELSISLYFRSGKGFPLIFLHGLGSSKNDYQQVFNLQDFKEHTILAFDFPGCGQSNYPDGLKFEVEDLVEITSQIISYFGLEDFVLIGHSMGGLTALLYTLRYPEQVKGFINIEGNLAPEDCQVFSRKTAQLSWEQFNASDHMKTLENQFKKLNYKGAQIFANTFKKSVMPRAFYDYCVSIVQHSDTEELLSIFKNLPIPCLFIYGEANNHLSYLSNLKKTGILVVEVPAAHHWPYYDNPSFFYQTLLKFLPNIDNHA